MMQQHLFWPQATGWTSDRAILVAMKEAPQTTTANRALAMGMVRA